MIATPYTVLKCECGRALLAVTLPLRDALICTNERCGHYMKAYALPEFELIRLLGAEELYAKEIQAQIQETQ